MQGIGLGLEGLQVREADMESSAGTPRSSPPTTTEYARPVAIPQTTIPIYPPAIQSHSLPPQPTRPWSTHAGRVSPIKEEQQAIPVASASERKQEERPSNPLLDVTHARVSSNGRGALYPGSVFKGTQTSGRSAYDVEVHFVVCFAFLSSLSRNMLIQ